MIRKLMLTLALTSVAALSLGCASTDYVGFNRHTQAEAKLWGEEISFSGFAPADLNGTYAYTVKYDQRDGNFDVNKMIMSYNNPVVGSFNFDGAVDVDGDDLQGGPGSLGGQFRNAYLSVDPGPGCQFGDNIRQQWQSNPGILYCRNGIYEEVDGHVGLATAMASLDQLFGSIWSGSLPDRFTLELNEIVLDGVSAQLETPFSIELGHNGRRTTGILLDVSNPGGRDLLKAILRLTNDGQGVTTVGLGFEGGLFFELPRSGTMAFNHDVLLATLGLDTGEDLRRVPVRSGDRR